jgi:hypothetical protein
VESRAAAYLRLHWSKVGGVWERQVVRRILAAVYGDHPDYQKEWQR